MKESKKLKNEWYIIMNCDGLLYTMSVAFYLGIFILLIIYIIHLVFVILDSVLSNKIFRILYSECF